MIDWTQVTDITRLQNRVMELEMELGTPVHRQMFNLTRHEQRVCEVIASRQLATRAMLYIALYNGDDDINQRILDVMICKARRKLAPHLIIIETVWGRGYRMPPESQALWRAYAKL